LLHDLALHLSEAGFISLLDSTRVGSNLKWEHSWDEFLTVARHWDDRKLVDLFGAEQNGAPVALVRNPLDHFNNLTESDRKLIGEFVRLNHADLAFQFSVRGFPGANGKLLQFGEFDSDFKNIAGIVARSHGFLLRQSVQLLEEMQISQLEHDDVHPLFLMAIIRIADFLELGRDRAPLIAFAYKELKSPISQREWRTNQAFRKISWGNPDPESIQIPAKPTDVYSYLELKRWLSAIQSELDTTWAVLGEVYGAHRRFCALGLAIRRVRSNVIDNAALFVKNASFVPRQLELGVAGPDVIKLFIEPLYGRHPEVGIRELIQNAVDAVRERWEFEKTHPLFTPSNPPMPNADVVVCLDDPDESGVATLTVRDEGIGMTEEVIANYFLRVGASFRRSIAWKREFALEASAAEGGLPKSRVLRSGRFGIGVLAAFLLGDEIEVSTRHITSERGIRFSVRLDLGPPSLDLAPIQLNYETGVPIGTTVKVRVNKANKVRARVGRKNVTTAADVDIFSDPYLWDWYCLEKPSVLRLQGRSKKILKQGVTVPSEGSELSAGWHVLRSTDYRRVHARASGSPGTSPPELVCNGLKVAAMGFRGFLQETVDVNLRDLFPSQGIFRLRTPEFSVFDPDGNLPLNLQRSGLSNLRLDFLAEAFAMQAKCALSKILTLAPTEPELTNDFIRSLETLFEFNQTVPVFFTGQGTGLLTRQLLSDARVKNCLLITTESVRRGWFAHFQHVYDAIICTRSGKHGTSSLYSLNQFGNWITKARVITRSREEPVVQRPLRFRYREFVIGSVSVYRTADCYPSLFKHEDIAKLSNEIQMCGSDLDGTDDFLAAELFMKDDLTADTPSELSISRHWQELLAEPTIPFDMVEQQRKLKHAYKSLREY